MKYTFKIFRTKDSRLDLFFEPPPIELRSTDTAHGLAKHFAAHAPVNLITIEAEDGSISKLWFDGGHREDIPIAAD